MTDTSSPARDGAPDPAALLDIARSLRDAALKAGADAAEAAVTESRALEAGVREGALEALERSESRDAGLRVFIGKRQAGVSFSDLSSAGQKLAVERAIAMARIAPEDPYCGLVEPEALARTLPEIALYEPAAMDEAGLEAAALTLEEAARAVKGVAMVSSAGASLGAGAVAVAASNGFESARRSSRYGLGVAAVAKNGEAMERDYDTHSARRFSDLKDPAGLGRTAGERAVARLGAGKLASGKRSVVFERRLAGVFVSSLLGAISGPSIARGTSFLRGKLGERVFAEGIDIIEDPLKDWSFGARAADGEGVACRPRALVEDGVLTTWLLNAASARQLGLPLTGHARRSLGGPPGAGASHVNLAPGEASLDDLIAEAGEGLLVTDMFGPSLNANTGDWSVGVAGFAIEAGQRAGPVSEITVAGNLMDIFARLIPGADIEYDGALNSPSVLVEGLSIGGR
ncbi:TldD/PmbA family protein [Alkalicaulis satelles]|uniref:TldD/PmbA family protein n=1 Tax=Alkalicaulis satelles TaxID=2609175 RepID=A0A5M6ZG27_9PROT|nr:TldD/PmbA family protein [Alkalicaulis satelles]KAA5803712.1 TldD/PmbA family protein [Alkalicaulis satelles]